MECVPYNEVASGPLKKEQVPAPATRILLELTSKKFFLLLHAIFIGLVLIYQSFWLLSEKTTAICSVYWGPYGEARRINPGTIMYVYKAGDDLFEGSSTRNGIPLHQKTIAIRYLPFFPSVSRVDSYEGNWLSFHIAWLIFFVITGMIFFIPNETIPKNSSIYLTRKKPWIHMIVR